MEWQEVLKLTIYESLPTFVTAIMCALQHDTKITAKPPKTSLFSFSSLVSHNQVLGTTQWGSLQRLGSSPRV